MYVIDKYTLTHILAYLKIYKEKTMKKCSLGTVFILMTFLFN